MTHRGGRRPRQIPTSAPVFVANGRWGRKRARVEQCAATLAAELFYGTLLAAGEPLRPGWRGVRSWFPHGPTGPSWEVDAEIRTNAVWRRGRLFLYCANCQRLAARLYIPVVGLEPRCRRCWGLAYVSQTWSYKPVAWLGKALGPVARATTYARREKRREAAQARYADRRLALRHQTQPDTGSRTG